MIDRHILAAANTVIANIPRMKSIVVYTVELRLEVRRPLMRQMGSSLRPQQQSSARYTSTN